MARYTMPIRANGRLRGECVHCGRALNVVSYPTHAAYDRDQNLVGFTCSRACARHWQAVPEMFT